MTEDQSPSILFSSLPKEVLLHIATDVPLTQLHRCREVCKEWKEMIDDLVKTEHFWHDLCMKHSPLIYKEARSKSGLSWKDVYESLSVWSKLDSVTETWAQYAPGGDNNMRGIKILEDGIIVACTRNAIMYYDSKTLVSEEMDPIETISGGCYAKHDENKHFVVYLHLSQETFDANISRKETRELKLKIVPIENGKRELDKVFEIDNVDDFLLVDENVYYIKNKREVYLWTAIDSKSKLLNSTEEDIKALSYSHHRLNVFTENRKIMTLIGGEFSEICTLTATDFIRFLQKYNFAGRFSNRLWRMFSAKKPSEDIRSFLIQKKIDNYADISTLRMYGDVVFIGTVSGLLLVYHNPFTNGVLDITNNKPDLYYDLRSGGFGCCFTYSPKIIIGIDVIEWLDGPVIVAASPIHVVVCKLSLKSSEVENDETSQ